MIISYDCVSAGRPHDGCVGTRFVFYQFIVALIRVAAQQMHFQNYISFLTHTYTQTELKWAEHDDNIQHEKSCRAFSIYQP